MTQHQSSTAEEKENVLRIRERIKAVLKKKSKGSDDLLRVENKVSKDSAKVKRVGCPGMIKIEGSDELLVACTHEPMCKHTTFMDELIILDKEDIDGETPSVMEGKRRKRSYKVSGNKPKSKKLIQAERIELLVAMQPHIKDVMKDEGFIRCRIPKLSGPICETICNGTFHIDKDLKKIGAPRFVYITENNSFATGRTLRVNHLCRDMLCCRKEHLFNSLAVSNTKRDECPGMVRFAGCQEFLLGCQDEKIRELVSSLDGKFLCACEHEPKCRRVTSMDLVFTN
jgi:hypothetical protein